MNQPSVISSVDRFDLEFPEELPDRLQWLESRLRTDRRHLVRLLGLSRAETVALEGQSWREIATRFEPQAERLETLLTHYLVYFDYDPEKAACFTEGFPARLRAGEFNLETISPLYRANASPVEREWALVAAVLAGGGSFLLALAAFLSQPVAAG